MYEVVIGNCTQPCIQLRVYYVQLCATSYNLMQTSTTLFLLIMYIAISYGHLLCSLSISYSRLPCEVKMILRGLSRCFPFIHGFYGSCNCANGVAKVGTPQPSQPGYDEISNSREMKAMKTNNSQKKPIFGTGSATMSSVNANMHMRMRTSYEAHYNYYALTVVCLSCLLLACQFPRCLQTLLLDV